MFNKFFLSTFLFIVNIMCFQRCTYSNPISTNEIIQDTIQRPHEFSAKAKYLNLGSNEEPLMAWVEFVGFLKKNGIVYPHIVGFKYKFNSGISKVNYYENINIRHGDKILRGEDVSILPFPYSGNIKIENNGDTLLFFEVLKDTTFSEDYEGIDLESVPTVILSSDGELLSTENLECFLQKISENNFKLILRGGVEIKYHRNNKFNKRVAQEISFLNRENGNIYFLDPNSILELDNKNDISKLTNP